MPPNIDPDDSEIRNFHEYLDVAGRRVIEVGCGDGRLTWRYASPAARVVGIDIDTEDLRDALDDCPPGFPVNFVLGKAEALPFLRETFDRAVLSWSL